MFDNPKNFNLDNWTGVFGSVLFWGALVLIALGVVVGILLGRRRGQSFEASGGSLTPLVLGAFLLMNAVFASFRGTVFNNLAYTGTMRINGFNLPTGLEFDGGAQSFTGTEATRPKVLLAGVAKSTS